MLNSEHILSSVNWFINSCLVSFNFLKIASQTVGYRLQPVEILRYFSSRYLLLNSPKRPWYVHFLWSSTKLIQVKNRLTLHDFISPSPPKTRPSLVFARYFSFFAHAGPIKSPRNLHSPLSTLMRSPIAGGRRHHSVYLALPQGDDIKYGWGDDRQHPRPHWTTARTRQTQETIISSVEKAG